MFYRNLAVYDWFGGIVLAEEEGLRLAEALGETRLNFILQTMGTQMRYLSFSFVPVQLSCFPLLTNLILCRLLTCGSTVNEAAAYSVALERACENQI